MLKKLYNKFLKISQIMKYMNKDINLKKGR